MNMQTTGRCFAHRCPETPPSQAMAPKSQQPKKATPFSTGARVYSFSCRLLSKDLLPDCAVVSGQTCRLASSEASKKEGPKAEAGGPPMKRPACCSERAASSSAMPGRSDAEVRPPALRAKVFGQSLLQSFPVGWGQRQEIPKKPEGKSAYGAAQRFVRGLWEQGLMEDQAGKNSKVLPAKYKTRIRWHPRPGAAAIERLWIQSRAHLAAHQAHPPSCRRDRGGGALADCAEPVGARSLGSRGR